MHHTNTSSMGSDSTTSLFFRDLGARWLTGRAPFESVSRVFEPAIFPTRSQIWDVALAGHTHTRTDRQIKRLPRPKPIESRARYFHTGG